jgi:predicted esterase
MDIYTINPTYKHTKTVIILHGMNQEYEEINNLCRSIKKSKRGIKFIFPICKPIDISWPDNVEKDSISWYNYFSRYDNHMKHDLIDQDEFNYKVKEICNIIKNETKYIDSKNITLVGISQGGTVAINSGLLVDVKLNQVICIDTIFLHSYFDYGNFKIKQVFTIFQSTKDNIYNPLFQDYTYDVLNNYGNIIIKNIHNLTHCEDMYIIEKFIISKL